MITNGGAFTVVGPRLQLFGKPTISMTITIVFIDSKRREIP